MSSLELRCVLGGNRFDLGYKKTPDIVSGLTSGHPRTYVTDPEETFLSDLLTLDDGPAFGVSPSGTPGTVYHLCTRVQLQIQRPTLMFKKDLGDHVIRVEAGQTVSLECEAGGRPVPTIHWLFDGSRMVQGMSQSVLDDEAFFEQTTHNQGIDTLQLGNTGGRLFISCATPAHAGQYACVAQTPTERIVSRTFLEVDGDIADCPSQFGKGLPPNIYMWEKQRLEFEGVDVQLFCRATGFPQPRMMWYDRNGDVITNDRDQYKILKNGDLLIRNINWFEHMGLFRCEAENKFGKDEIQVFLYPLNFLHDIDMKCHSSQLSSNIFAKKKLDQQIIPI
ncbi:hypothetical protein LSH36_36g00008 [Paralvinella palmiformis]|uniref:Ig-like domain-containing protein n=1 Tax=Paralvinella palmiformis TaxID=53620 RepID=A0AAD9K8I8_9ANNE|nr:hypothetical protein LSH36_36g00008 [Paralvinella palmiformis]